MTQVGCIIMETSTLALASLDSCLTLICLSVEENYFLNTELAIVTDIDSDEDGYAIDRNNIFVNSTEEITQVGSLTPPYSYT